MMGHTYESTMGTVLEYYNNAQIAHKKAANITDSIVALAGTTTLGFGSDV